MFKLTNMFGDKVVADKKHILLNDKVRCAKAVKPTPKTAQGHRAF